MRRLSNSDYSLIFVSALTILLQGRLIWSHGFQFADSDQTVMWQIANDLGQGDWFVPYFYGQDYNFPLESYLAVPLIKLGVPVWMALPLTTSFMFLWPFFTLAYFFRRSNLHFAAMISVGIPLFMAIEFNLVSSLSRGFVSGIFVTGFIPLISLRESAIRVFMTGFFSAFALWFNPNAIVFLLPLVLWMFLRDNHKTKFVLLALTGTVIPVVLKYLSDAYMQDHQEFVKHTLWGDTFTLVALKDGILEVSRIFQFSLPVLWHYDALVFLVLLFSGIVLWKKGSRMEAIATMGAVGILFLSLGFAKVHDGVESLYLNTTRMWLALPLLLALVFGWLSENKKFTARTYFILCLISAGYFGFKQNQMRGFLDQLTAVRNHGPVALANIGELCQECTKIRTLAEEQNATLICVKPNEIMSIAQSEFYGYACPLLVEKFPTVYLAAMEKRPAFELAKFSDQHSRTLIYGWQELIEADPIQMKITELSSTPRTYLLETEAMSTHEILAEIGK